MTIQFSIKHFFSDTAEENFKLERVIPVGVAECNEVSPCLVLVSQIMQGLQKQYSLLYLSHQRPITALKKELIASGEKLELIQLSAFRYLVFNADRFNSQYQRTFQAEMIEVQDNDIVHQLLGATLDKMYFLGDEWEFLTHVIQPPNRFKVIYANSREKRGDDFGPRIKAISGHILNGKLLFHEWETFPYLSTLTQNLYQFNFQELKTKAVDQKNRARKISTAPCRNDPSCRAVVVFGRQEKTSNYNFFNSRSDWEPLGYGVLKILFFQGGPGMEGDKDGRVVAGIEGNRQRIILENDRIYMEGNKIKIDDRGIKRIKNKPLVQVVPNFFDPGVCYYQWKGCLYSVDLNGEGMALNKQVLIAKGEEEINLIPLNNPIKNSSEEISFLGFVGEGYEKASVFTPSLTRYGINETNRKFFCQVDQKFFELSKVGKINSENIFSDGFGLLWFTCKEGILSIYPLSAVEKNKKDLPMQLCLKNDNEKSIYIPFISEVEDFTLTQIKRDFEKESGVFPSVSDTPKLNVWKVESSDACLDAIEDFFVTKKVPRGNFELLHELVTISHEVGIFELHHQSKLQMIQTLVDDFKKRGLSMKKASYCLERALILFSLYCNDVEKDPYIHRLLLEIPDLMGVYDRIDLFLNTNSSELSLDEVSHRLFLRILGA